MDVLHDPEELLVDFLGTPAQALAVLRHLKTADADAAGVAGLTGRVEDLGVLEHLDGTGRRGHVGTFGHSDTAVGHEGLGSFLVELVLCGAGACDVGFLEPGLGAVADVLGRGVFLDVLADAAAVDVLELHDVVELLAVDAVGVVDVAVGVAHGEDFTSELQHFLGAVLCHVSGTGDEHGLALDALAACAEHGAQEVDVAVAGGFGADERAAELEALAGEHAAEFARELLIHTEHVAYLTAAYADVACGDVHVGADMACKFKHEGLAEAHDFGVRLAAGREVGAALGAAHGQRGERVLEGLLEGQELQDAQVHALVEAYAAFVRADGVVVLHTVAHVGLHATFVVGPCDAELVHAVGDAEALDEVGALEFGVLVVLFLDGSEYFFYSLVVLRLAWEALLQVFQYLLCVHLCMWV